MRVVGSICLGIVALGVLLACEGALGADGWPLFDAIVGQGVPAAPLRSALSYLAEHRAEIRNQKFLTLVDYSRPITEKRMHVINLEDGKVEHFQVSHARKSDPNLTGIPELFSNVFNSEKTALGFFLTSYAYQGSLGRGLVLQGLSKFNSRAEERKIVLHGWFVGPEYASHYGTEECPLQGGCPTLGCFGVPFSAAGPLIEKIREGSLLLAFTKTGGVRGYDL